MQIKWLEDFVALAQAGSFVQAAEARHVTHPAFGRRIQALEAWAGTPLVVRGASPVRLTPAGERLREHALQTVRGLEAARDELQSIAGRHARTVTLATGRTLARTVVADWLVRLQPVVGEGGELRVVTQSLSEIVRIIERNEADFALMYHHPALVQPLDARRFSYQSMATDRLVPVVRADARGAPLHRLADAQVPYLAYADSLALGRLVDDHLANHPQAPDLVRRVRCDSADALHAYVARGLGVAWLPWSMVHDDCRAGRFALAGGRGMEMRYDVRIYRPKHRLGDLAEAVWQSLARR